MSSDAKTLDWFPFYITRFLASRKVRRMNAEQGGAYLFLMCEQWEKGFIPDDDAEIADIARCSVEVARGVLSSCFERTDKGWANSVLATIRDVQAHKAEQAGRAATARWEKMRTHSERNADAMPEEESRGEQKRKEKRKTPWRFCPEDWEPNAKHIRLSADLGVDLPVEVEKFREHEFKDPKTDADRAFSRWLRNAQSFAARAKPNASVRLHTKAEQTADYLRTRGLAS